MYPKSQMTVFLSPTVPTIAEQLRTVEPPLISFHRGNTGNRPLSSGSQQYIVSYFSSDISQTYCGFKITWREPAPLITVIAG